MPEGAVSPRGSVLIVDDDEHIRRALVRVLARAGFGVELASNGSEALARLERLPRPDVIILDLRMPFVDGHEFVKAVEGLPERPPPIVVVTADFPPSPPLRVDACFPKPFEVARLVEMVGALCDRPPPSGPPGRASR